MMFNQPVTLIRTSRGEYNDDGIYEPASEVRTQIQASVQPLGLNELNQLQVNVDGASVIDYVKIYSSIELHPPSTDYDTADVVEYRGKLYRVIFSAAYQSGVINHYKAIAVKA